MSRAVIFTTPTDQPTLPMRDFTAALVRQGEEIIYYAPQHYQAAAQTAGTRFCAYEHSEPLNFDNKILLGLQLIQAAQKILPAVLRDLQKSRPDYILYDSRSVWGWYAARILKIPAVSLFAAPVINREVLIRSGKLSGELSGYWRHLEGMSHYRKTVSELEQDYRITGPSISAVLYNKGDLNLVQTIDLLQPWVSSLDYSYQFIGVNDEIPTQAHAKFIIAPDAAAIGLEVAQAFDKAVMQNPDLLQETRWMVTHGEMTAIHQALLEGRMLMMVPKNVEQDILAEHIQQLGVGIRLPNETFHQLELYLHALMTLQEGQEQRPLQRIRSRLTEVNSVQTLLDEITRFKHSLGLNGTSV